jgi:hypothetical protein
MVNFNPITPAVDPKAYIKASAGKSADAGKGVAAKGELVQFSATSGELKSAKSVVDSLPEVRLDKVEEIMRKIKINDYPLENSLDEGLKKLWENNIVV